MSMDMDIRSRAPRAPRAHDFTPINSPKSSAMDAAIKLKQEQDDDDDDEALIPSIKAEETEEITTPRKTKRTRKPASTSTPTKKAKKNTTEASEGNLADSPAGNSTPAAGGGAGGTPTRATLPSIPASLAAAGTEDRMILRLRDDERRAWTDITNKFMLITGITVGGSTLRMRYNTMKANFVCVSVEDVSRLIRIKKEVEEKFEAEKWHRISEGISQDGGAKYPNAALQKKFKELSKNSSSTSGDSSSAAAGGSNGVKDEEEEE
ncbi:hypothetical protein BDW59DRAFT_161745 [Aspergillus cavernicola]|uniref:Uncharacterized protein n=1 Tax=Aspergillus cavernicola TaxID=176166 RepID=A0ABR4IBZ9_9EURO